MQAVVMAGGAGTRLRPLTTAVPKALLPIVGEPMLARVIRLLSEHGVDRCVVTLQHQASVVLKYFGCNGAARSVEAATLAITGGANNHRCRG